MNEGTEEIIRVNSLTVDKKFQISSCVNAEL